MIRVSLIEIECDGCGMVFSSENVRQEIADVRREAESNGWNIPMEYAIEEMDAQDFCKYCLKNQETD